MLCYCIKIKPWWKFVLSNEPKLYLSINLIPELDLKINRACHLDEKEMQRESEQKECIRTYQCCSKRLWISYKYLSVVILCDTSLSLIYIGTYRNFRFLSRSCVELWSSCFYLHFLFTRKRDNFIVHVVENSSIILVQLAILSRHSFKLSKKYFRFLSFTIALR